MWRSLIAIDEILTELIYETAHHVPPGLHRNKESTHCSRELPSVLVSVLSDGSPSGHGDKERRFGGWINYDGRRAQKGKRRSRRRRHVGGRK